MHERPEWIGVLLFLVLLIGLILVFRQVFCWYWKINQSVKNQERIIELLESINNKLESK